MTSSNYEITNVVEAARAEVGVGEFGHAAWSGARPVQLARYWSGEEAPEGRRAQARVLWGEEALVVRFDCRQEEPPVVSAAPRTEQKTIGLWDRDVCELFVAPDASAPERYFEFEAAPTGEWLDLAINLRPRGRETDWHFRSGMTAAALGGEGSLTIALRVPFRALGGAPRPGQRWRANLYRCVGSGPSRGYLAWQPTHAPQPNFHVPEKFGWMLFK